MQLASTAVLACRNHETPSIRDKPHKPNLPNEEESALIFLIANATSSRLAGWRQRFTDLKSLPPNRDRRLPRDVINHPRDVPQLVDDPRRALIEEVVQQMCPVSRHEIDRLHGEQRDHPLIGTTATNLGKRCRGKLLQHNEVRNRYITTL